jgi:predicted ribosomally synthesized peptide with SipW-like signal peptide
MKKIIFSGSILVAVVAVGVGATTAFFNDTETSTGNIIVAGAIDLTVDSFGAFYNDEDLGDAADIWTARDLTDEVFFTFDDIKPGDRGRRHISLHVDDNEAWACLFLVNKDDQENVRNDSEIDAGDLTDDEGELSSEIDLFAWQDNDSDLNYDPDDGEVELPRDGVWTTDSFFDITYSIDVADSNSGTPVLEPTGPAATRNIAVAWCAGDQGINHTTGEITCDGSAMGDKAQSDSLTSDLVVFAEQTRSNPDFLCKDVVLDL